jgi:ABC-2 type transport system ATP-binding protein
MPVGNGPPVLIAAGRAVDDDGLALEDFGIRRPSLDEVFLALTAHTEASAASMHGTGGAS